MLVAPFVSGNYQVKTTAEWTAKKATIVSQDGTDMAGTAKLSMLRQGDYEVTLTLRTHMVLTLVPSK